MTLQPKLTKSISNFYNDLKIRTAPCIIRIPAHEIEKNGYAFINGHNEFDTNKWRLKEILRNRMSMYVIMNELI